METLCFVQPRKATFAILFVSALLLLSCERTQTESDVSPTMSENENFAVFKTRAAFDEAVAKLSKGNYADVQALETQHNFVSLNTLLQKAEQEEAANHEREMKIEATNPKLAKTMKHEISKTIRENPDAFIYSAEEGVELNLIMPNLAGLLNKDGLVKIEDKIVQYKHDFIKIIGDGDARKVALLERTKTTDKQQNITVNPVRFSKSEQVSNGKVAYGYTRSCEGTSAGSPTQWRILVYEEAFDSGDNFLKFWIGQYKIRTLKRGFFGSWQNYNTRSQYGNVTHYGPQFSTFASGFTPTPIVLPNGLTGWNNSNGYETSELIYRYFQYSINYQTGISQSPYNTLEIKFSPSNTARFDFSVGNCGCNI